MANMRAIFVNLIEDIRCVLSSSGSPVLPVDNVKNTNREDRWRIDANTNAGCEIYVNWGGDAVRASAAAFLRHNLDIDGTIRVIFYENDDLTGELWDSTALPALNAVALGDHDFGLIVLGAHEYSNYGGYTQTQIWADDEDGYVIKSAKIVFDNTTNVDGVIDLSRLILGHYYEFAYNPEEGLKFAIVTETTAVITEAGGRYTDGSVKYRRMALEFKYIEEADRVVLVEALFYVGSEKGFFVAVLPDASETKRIRELSGEYVAGPPLPEFAMLTNHSTTTLNLFEA